MSGLKWTKEEDTFIINNYKKITAEEISKIINRSTQSIYLRSFKLNLRTAQNPIHIGQKFNNLTVIRWSDKKTKNRQSYVFCRCVCGIEKEFLSSNLNHGYTTSCGCVTRQRHGQVSFNERYASYRKGAIDRGLNFDLSHEEFDDLISKNCSYCDAAPKPFNKYLRIKSNTIKALPETFEEAWIKINGIDRVDNFKGYSMDNCVTCCCMCNTAKMDRPLEEFKTWISAVHKNLLMKET